MSYVIAQKNLLSEDLKNLISLITGCEEGSDEFTVFENNAWSTILYYNCPSLDKNRIKSRLYGFIEKFKIHAYTFPQKARNLELLFEYFLDLDSYEEDVKWNLLQLLLLLSRHPTEAKDDDEPITFPLCALELDEDVFDWGAYLKQDLPQYILPSSDDSFSEDEGEVLRSTKAIYQASREIMRHRHGSSGGNQTDPSYSYNFGGPSHFDISSTITRIITLADTRTIEETVNERGLSKDELKAALVAKENHRRLQLIWWIDPTYREIPPSKMPVPNACFTWEQNMSVRGVSLGETRVLSESKAMRELIWVLTHPGSYFIIKKCEGFYKPQDKVSISSVNPVDFYNTLSEICPYVSIIEKINSFIEGIDSSSFGVNMCSTVPWTFVEYASALKHVMDMFRSHLSIIEAYITKQDNIYMISYLLLEVRPWLNHLKYIYNVHTKAVPEDWRNQENWINASRLLTILYNSLDYASGWAKAELNIIFLKTFRPYIEILETWLIHSKYTDYQDEFLIKRPSRAACEGNLIVRDYKSQLLYLNIQNTTFLDNFVYYSIRACSSVDFQIVLRKNSYHKDLNLMLYKNETEPKITPFYIEFLSSLVNDVEEEGIVHETSFVPNRKLITEKYESLKSSNIGLETSNISKSEINCENTTNEFFCIPNSCNGENFVITDKQLSSAFKFVILPFERNKNFTKVILLLNRLEKIDTDSTDLARLIKKHFNIIISERMQPKGFARDTLLNSHKLLEHLSMLKSVYLFLGGVTMSIFTQTLFSKVTVNGLNTISWTNELRELLYKDYPVYGSNFIITMPLTKLPIRKILINVDISYPDFIEFTHQININCLIEPPLNLVITSESIEKYKELFNLLLQTKWALFCLSHLSFKDLAFEGGDTLRTCLISLRMFLLHNVSTFEKYFISINSEDFDGEITQVCSVARDVHVIATAHEKLLNQRRKYCFLYGSPKILECLLTLFKFCQSFTSLWKLSLQKHLFLKISSELSNFEIRYQDCVNELAENLLQLGKDHVFKTNVNFNYLCDELFNNMPGKWD